MINNFSKRYLVLLFTLFSVSNVCALEGDYATLFGFGYDYGGKTMGSVVMSNGDSREVKSHDGLLLYGGVEYKLSENIVVKTTVGYKIDSVTVSNGELKFSRFPLEIIVSKLFGVHQFGGGPIYHFASKFQCKIDNLCDFNRDIKDAFGLVLQYEYVMFISKTARSLKVGVRYSDINYEATTNGDRVRGSGLGINFSLLF